MSLPTDAIRDALVSDADHIDNDTWRASSRMAFEQLKALLDYIAKLEAENKEQAKCIADSTFGGWYG